MLESDGIFESEVNVAIADSAHVINYDAQFLRIAQVRSILGNFTLDNEKYRCEGLWFEAEITRSIVVKDCGLRRRTTPETIIIWVWS